MKVIDKTIDELLPTDRVMIELGAKTQRNETNGKDIIIDPVKQLDVTYKYYTELVAQEDEFDVESGYCPPLGRTVHLLGLADYTTKKNDVGDSFQESIIIPFATEASRLIAQQQASLAEAQRQQDEADQERVRLEAQIRAKVEAELAAEAEAKAKQNAPDLEAMKAQWRADYEAELAEKAKADKAAADAKKAADKAAADAKKAAEEAAKQNA